MSQTRKEIIAELDAVLKAREDDATTHAAALSEIQSRLDAEVLRAETAEKALIEVNARVEELTLAAAAVAAEHDAALAALNEQVAAGKAFADEISAKLEASGKDLNLARQALEDPRYVDAAIKAFKGDLQAAADAEADRAEAAEQTEKSKIEQWQAISDPKERRAFYLANEKAIKAEIKESEAK